MKWKLYNIFYVFPSQFSFNWKCCCVFCVCQFLYSDCTCFASTRNVKGPHSTNESSPLVEHHAKHKYHYFVCSVACAIFVVISFRLFCCQYATQLTDIIVRLQHYFFCKISDMRQNRLRVERLEQTKRIAPDCLVIIILSYNTN